MRFSKQNIVMMKMELTKRKFQKFSSWTRGIANLLVITGALMCALYLALDPQFTNVWNQGLAIGLMCGGFVLRIVSDILLPFIFRHISMKMIDDSIVFEDIKTHSPLSSPLEDEDVGDDDEDDSNEEDE